MSDCLFCKIAKKKIPSSIIYEDDSVLAFLDINPKTKGHTVIIPKEHSENILTIKKESWVHLTQVIPKIARAVVKASDSDGFNLKVNNGESAGQEIMHTHVHVIPRKKEDHYVASGHVSYGDDNEKMSYLEDIKSTLDKS